MVVVSGGNLLHKYFPRSRNLVYLYGFQRCFYTQRNLPWVYSEDLLASHHRECVSQSAKSVIRGWDGNILVQHISDNVHTNNGRLMSVEPDHRLNIYIDWDPMLQSRPCSSLTFAYHRNRSGSHNGYY